MKLASLTIHSSGKPILSTMLTLALGLAVSRPVFSESTDKPTRKVLAGPNETVHVDVPVSNGQGPAGDGSISVIGAVNAEIDSTTTTSSGIDVTIESEDGQICRNEQNGHTGPIYIRNCDPNGYCTVRIVIAPEFCSNDSSGSVTGGIGGGYGVGNVAGGGGYSYSGSTGVEIAPWLIRYLRDHGIIRDILVQIPPGRHPTINQLLEYPTVAPNHPRVRDVLTQQNHTIATWTDLYHDLVNENQVPEEGYVDNLCNQIRDRIGRDNQQPSPWEIMLKCLN